MKCQYRENKIYCGNYLEVNIYPVYPTGKSRRKKNKPTSEVQKTLNQHNAENKLIRLLHTNFDERDLEIHLTYDENHVPADEEQAKKDIQNFLRRVKRYRKKNNLDELKYISVTEKGSSGRLHHHVTLNGGIDRDILEQLWGKGYANTKRLQFNKTGLVGLGRYIVKDPVFSKRWNASRNLKKPKERTNDSRITRKKAKELSRESENRVPYEKLYPDYYFAECKSFYNDFNGGYYLSVRMYRKGAKII